MALKKDVTIGVDYHIVTIKQGVYRVADFKIYVSVSFAYNLVQVVDRKLLRELKDTDYVSIKGREIFITKLKKALNDGNL